jgi:hypothetical protein|tara:strand:+ start:765 stop:929 length:165 start_codon:yes stop_codon:yes gene_type:complete
MNDFFQKYCMVVLIAFMAAGCVEVGGSSSEVCSGTECGTHDESDNSVDSSTTTD